MSGSLPALFGRTITSVHCLGVGGMGMGPLALYLAGRGFRVTGEDDGLMEPMRGWLERGGVTLTTPGGVPEECELVVRSSAVSDRHPAFVSAMARGIRMVRRGELLAEITRDQKLVAVCGSHGKTTTTAMLATLLRHSEFPAGYVLGGLFSGDGFPPSAPGSNGWIVAEIDESDGTIEHFSPHLTVVVNLDWDHPDHYRDPGELEAAFRRLASRTRLAVLMHEESASREWAQSIPRSDGARLSTFGSSGHYRGRLAAQAEGVLELELSGAYSLAKAQVRATGAFNAMNAMAALAAASEMGLSLSSDALLSYPGVHRRQHILADAGGITVVEDYAHHPAEIRALLTSLREWVRPKGRLIVVFQPHRYSRTAQFKDAFAEALALADRVTILDVYSAGESPVPGGETSDLQARFGALPEPRPVNYFPGDPAQALTRLRSECRPGDLVAFVGAGDIEQLARQWADGLSADAIRMEVNWDVVAESLRAQVSAESRITREEALAPKTTLRVGGAARVYAEPASREDLQRILKWCRAAGVPVLPLGRGSNLVVPDEGVDALVLSLRHPAWETFEPLADGRVRAGAGLRLKNLCGLAAREGLTGFEFLEGIPGNLGGALRMNAGAMGGWMFDVVDEVEFITFAGELLTLPRSAMHVDYRHCTELQEAIAVGAVLTPSAQADREAVARQIDVYRDKRQKSQPREPSAGCIFKNPPADAAGRLIDLSGLKGERVGGAEVSAVHGNFIINRGTATSADVIELVRRVRARVETEQGIRLEPEVLLYGRRWEDVL